MSTALLVTTVAMSDQRIMESCWLQQLCTFSCARVHKTVDMLTRF